MLVLSRREGERIHIGDGVIVTLVAVEGNRIRVGIDAPPDVRIRREELLNSADRITTASANFRRPK